MQLETPRLILREFTDQDCSAVLAYQSDPRYLQYYEWTERKPQEVQEFVQRFINQQKEQPRYKFQLAVTLRSNRQLIGNCGIRMAYADARVADIGYELAPEHWGQGYATEAARAIVEFGFTQLRVQRIWSWCIADNVASAHVLQKLGLKLEGRLREKEFFKGRSWDVLTFGVLASERQTQQQAK